MGGTGGTFMPGKPLGPTFYIPLCPCTRENVCTRRYIAVYFSSFHSTTSTPAPPPSPRPLTPPPPDHPTTLLYARPTPLDQAPNTRSLSTIFAYDCLSLLITAYHCLSLPITAYHCLSLPITAFHCLSLPITAYPPHATCRAFPFTDHYILRANFHNIVLFDYFIKLHSINYTIQFSKINNQLTA
jgi:hypothetical protein